MAPTWSPVLVATMMVLVIPSYALVFNENVHRVQVSGSNCVLDLSSKFFLNYSTIALVRIEREIKSNLNVGISTDDLIMQKLFNEGSWTIMMKYFPGNSNSSGQQFLDYGFEKIHNYVLVLRDSAHIEAVLGELSRAVAWNPHANFLVYIDGLVDEWQQFCEKLIGIFWRYWVINLTIMVPSEEIYGHLVRISGTFQLRRRQYQTEELELLNYIFQFFTWFPFQEKFETLGTCKESLLEPPELHCFPNKLPRNLNQSQVKIGAVHSPPFVIQNVVGTDLLPTVDIDTGIEMQILKTVAWRANFQVKLMTTFMTEGGTDNETWGIFKELQDKRFDIAIGTISPTIWTHRKFDFTVQYMQDVVTWIVPSDNMIPQWVGLLLIFQPSAYAATFGLLIFFWVVVSSIVRVFKWNFRREHKIYRAPISFLLITVGILFSNIPNKFPRTTFLKYLLVIWSLFCLHWSTAYSGTLMSVLTNTHFTAGIETEMDLIGMKLNLKTTNRTRRYFGQLNGDFDGGVSMILCLTEANCLQEMGEKRDSALAMSRYHFDFVKSQYRDDQGYYRVKCLKTNIVTSPIEMLLSKGNPLLPRINEILLDIIESGLIDYWTRNVTKDQTADQDEGRFKEQKVLNLANLQGGFFLLGIGLGISFLTFIAEILYDKKYPRAQNE